MSEIPKINKITHVTVALIEAEIEDSKFLLYQLESPKTHKAIYLDFDANTDNFEQTTPKFQQRMCSALFQHVNNSAEIRKRKMEIFKEKM
jgi:methionyl-tRNA synthetase